jgi:predicted PurR-regulated permease PerM
MKTKNSVDIYKIWVTMAAFVVIVAGIKAASTIIIPLLLSIFIATVSAPAMFALERLKLPRILAFLIVLACVIGLLLGFAYILSSSLDGFLANMPQYKAKLLSMVDFLQAFFQRFGMELSKKDLQLMFDPSELLNIFGTFLKTFSTILSKSFLIFLGVTFMLFETSSLKTKIYILINKDSSLENPFEMFSKNLNKYLAIKTIISLITGIIIGLGLLILGVDFALLLGMIAFLLNYIPNIGAVIAAVPAVLVALVGLDSNSILLVITLYVSVNIIMGNIIEPRYMGKGLGLSVLVIFFSLVFWGWVLGPVGMFLAVPISMTIKIALDSHPSTRPIAMILSSIDNSENANP